MKFQKCMRRLSICLMVFVLAGCGKTEITQEHAEESRPSEIQVEAVLESSQIEETVETEEEVEIDPNVEPVKKQEFPLIIEDGKLMIESLFQYSGINFDCDEEFCEEIGALQLKNTSGEYLESASIIVKLTEELEFQFLIEDVPAGQSVIAFETANEVYEENHLIEDVLVNAVWNSEIFEVNEKLNLSIGDMAITVTNISQEPLENIVVKYHCSLDGIYLGGKSYKATIEKLNSQESINLDASECYLGEVSIANVIY